MPTTQTINQLFQSIDIAPLREKFMDIAKNAGCDLERFKETYGDHAHDELLSFDILRECLALYSGLDLGKSTTDELLAFWHTKHWYRCIIAYEDYITNTYPEYFFLEYLEETMKLILTKKTTKRKPLQIYLNETERQQLEDIQEALEQKTMSSTVKKLVKIFKKLGAN